MAERQKEQDRSPVDGVNAPDGYGVGVLNDGKLNVVTEEEAYRRGLERDMMQSDEEPDDLGDLADVEKAFGV